MTNININSVEYGMYRSVIRIEYARTTVKSSGVQDKMNGLSIMIKKEIICADLPENFVI